MMRKYFLYWPLLMGVAFSAIPGIPNTARAEAAALADLLSAVDTTSARILEAQVGLARTKAVSSRRGAFPNPTLFGSSEELGQSGESVRENTIGIRQELSFLWSRRAQQGAASAAVTAAEASYNAERRYVYTDVLLKLIRLQQIEASLRLSDTLQMRYDEILRANQAREREGDISGFDAQRVRFESVSVNNRRVALLTEKQELVSQLGRETGIHEAELLTIRVDALADLAFVSATEAVEYARSHAPEAKHLSAAEQAARYSESSAKRLRWPGLAVGVGQKSTDRDESGLLVEAELEIPLFNRRNAAVRQAKAERFQARRLKQVYADRLESEIADAFGIWQGLRNRTGDTVDPETLTAHLNAAHSLYLSGEAGYIELLDAFSSSEQILADYFQTQTAKWQADLGLRQLTGYPILEAR